MRDGLSTQCDGDRGKPGTNCIGRKTFRNRSEMLDLFCPVSGFQLECKLCCLRNCRHMQLNVRGYVFELVLLINVKDMKITQIGSASDR